MNLDSETQKRIGSHTKILEERVPMGAKEAVQSIRGKSIPIEVEGGYANETCFEGSSYNYKKYINNANQGLKR